MKKISIIGFISLIIFLLCISCTKKIKASNIYNKEQSLILILSKKEQIEQTCTDKIWSSIYKLSNEDYTFKDLFLMDMKEFIRYLNILSLMANKENVELDLTEVEKIKSASSKYFNNIKNSKIYEFQSILEEDIYKLFLEYTKALKIKDTLLEKSGCEISESEAKVIVIDKIVCENKQDALLIKESLENNQKNFSANHTIERNIKIKKNILPKEIEDKLFKLENNEYSDVIEYNSKFLIFKLINPYDIEATKDNKENLLKEKSLEILSTQCEQFALDNKIIIKDDFWNTIEKESNQNLDIDNFFDFYEEEFNVGN